MQCLHDDAVAFAKADPDHFDFIVNALIRKPPQPQGARRAQLSVIQALLHPCLEVSLVNGGHPLPPMRIWLADTNVRNQGYIV